MEPLTGPFEKFSESARKALIAAQQIAVSMGQAVGPEHILLAITVNNKSLSFDILKDNLVSADQIRLLLNMRAIQSAKPGALSLDAKQVIKRAISIAAVFNHTSIDAEHLLMACVSDPKSKSYVLLNQLGVDPERIKTQINSLFRDLSEMDSIIQQKINQLNTPLPNKDRLESRSTKSNKKNTPAINYFTTDLTRKARRGELDNVIGRKQEITRAIHVLARKTKNNPVFIGEPGVGKTAIVEGIAQIIAEKKAPYSLSDKRILSLDLPLLIAGTMYRGQFEERLKKLIEEVNKQKNIILFIDEIHNIVGAGSAEGSIDAANILKPALTKGNIRIIGATTIEEYRKYIEKDAALERRLQPILVREPSESETISILKGLRPDYEKYHRVNISDEAIEASVKYATRYINDRFLPDKAIDLIDEAAASLVVKEKINTDDHQQEIKTFTDQLENIQKTKNKLVSAEKYNEALKWRDQEMKTQEKIRLLKKVKTEKRDIDTVDRKTIARIIVNLSGIPLGELIGDERQKLSKLEKILNQQIIDQEEATRDIAQAIIRNRVGISDNKRPIGSFIFLGPTGVGKTELVKVLAREYYGNENALIKIDMSEFMERHNVSRLVGAPPGYIGYEEAGKLTESVRRKPYSIVLFDEIEKAHPEVFNLLLQILEDGYLTDAHGRRVNFRHTLIVMTSNIGIKEISSFGPIGFSQNGNQDGYEHLRQKIMQQLKERMNPEFINRVDRIIVFHPLSSQSYYKIAHLELKKFAERIAKGENIKLSFGGDVITFIAKIGTDREFGARPLRRAIQQHIENIIAKALIQSVNLKEIKLAVRRNNIIIESPSKALKNVRKNS